MKRYVLVVGLQKSGTNLLVALLERSGRAQRVGPGMEGGPVGQKPAFVPVHGLGGEVYRRHGGRLGHEFGVDDATPATIRRVRRTLEAQLAADPAPPHQVRFSKNPYNSVRLPFFRRALPEAVIVAVIRRAVPNTYSLLKRYQPESGTSRPVDGWWGVKPAGWLGLVADDKLEQAARQWNAVNRKMLSDGPDLVVWYQQMCHRPGDTVRAICAAASGPEGMVPDALTPLRCCDDEATSTGSELGPKYHRWKDSGNLRLAPSGAATFPPLTKAQIHRVSEITAATEAWAETRHRASPHDERGPGARSGRHGPTGGSAG